MKRSLIITISILSLFFIRETYAEAPRPNVLFIAVDDLNDWVGCLGGHPQTQTPNIDRLAARGMLFTNAHCQGTMCNPSRISLLWGRRPSSTGFYSNRYPVSKEPEFLDSHVSLPAHFAASGYKTLTAGKVFHGGTPIRKHAQVVGPRLGQWRKGLDQPVHKKPKGWHGTWDFGPQDYDETKFTDHVTATWVAEQLGSKHDKPFFLSFGFYRPHVPFFPPRRVYDSFKDVQLPRVDEDDWSDLPDAARKVTLSNPKIPTHDWMREDGRWQQAVHAYLACVRWTDEQLGRVLDSLDNGPHAKNTIVVLFSDHGYHLGEKQRWSKFSLWERTTRVPLIISVPGGVKGKSDKPVELLSLYPTLIELCGLPATLRLEGVSLRPLLGNPNAGWEYVAISTLGQNNHAVRDLRWRYIRYADGSEELYDHQSDPNEWKNLAAEAPAPLHAEVIARLKKHLPKTNAPQRGTTPRSRTANQTDVTTADVIVYGSTPGGFCAAIAAAREGASVILLEPTNHVGGMNTGGLSHCDSNQMVRSTLMGLFDEWHTRVIKDYTDRGLKAPYNPAKKDTSRWTFEPHVAMRVTMKMLEEAKVNVLTEGYLKSVTKDGPRITSLVTKNRTFTARVFVDGTYEGDLMAAAGVDWTIGREGREEYVESLAGKQYPKRKMYINGFDGEGRLLPLVTTEDAGDEEVGDKKIMTYSFRLCLTTDPKNRVSMPKPDNYDPAKFEIVRRALKAGEKRVGFDLYPLPGNKLDGNNSIGGQFSIGLVGGANHWHSADEAGRKKIWEAHKQYTLEFIHFLTTDPAVPVKNRIRYTRLGLCKDEFVEHDHFPPALYVRESRRMKGMYVISQKDILEKPRKDDPIAISSFPIDSHDVQRVALKGGGVINEGTIFPVRIKGRRTGYAYHVPYRAILPQPGQCDNLLVPVALSCTHVGISSLRIEGAWMVIGQGAGVAAALAAKDNIPVQELKYGKLRERLVAQKQVLDLPEDSNEPTATPMSSINPKTLQGIVLDDAQAKLTGDWSRSTNFKPHIGSGYVFTGKKGTKGDGKSTATFRFKAPKSGRYQVLMAYSAHETRAKNVPVTVTTGTHSETIVVDQTVPLPGGKHFRPIDTVDLKAAVETVIQITNADTNGFVILDALQLLPIEPELKTDE